MALNRLRTSCPRVLVEELLESPEAELAPVVGVA
jgi:hypothetical protein